MAGPERGALGSRGCLPDFRGDRVCLAGLVDLIAGRCVSVRLSSPHLSAAREWQSCNGYERRTNQ